MGAALVHHVVLQTHMLCVALISSLTKCQIITELRFSHNRHLVTLAAVTDIFTETRASGYEAVPEPKDSKRLPT